MGHKYSWTKGSEASLGAIQVIPRFVPMSESEAEELATLIARLLVENARRELREKAKTAREDRDANS